MFKGFFFHILERKATLNNAISNEFEDLPSCSWVIGRCISNEKVANAYFEKVLFSQILEIQYSEINKMSPWFVRKAEKFPEKGIQTFLCVQTALAYDETSLEHRLWYPTQTEIPLDYLMEIEGFNPKEEQWIFYIDLSYAFQPSGSAWRYYKNSDGNFTWKRLIMNNLAFDSLPWKKRSIFIKNAITILKPFASLLDLITFPLQLFVFKKI